MEPIADPPYAERPTDPGRPPQRRQGFGRGRVVGLVVLLALSPILVSYGRALTAPGDDSVFIRTVEWVRDHGGAGLVSEVERLWYTANAPPTGGPPPEIPAAPEAEVAPTAPTAAPESSDMELPLAISSPASPTLPGEGEWRPAGRLVNGRSAVLTTFVRPDDVHTSLLVGVARLDPKLLAYHYVAGLTEPGGGPGPEGGKLPKAWLKGLVATFNSGFKHDDCLGGALVAGRTEGKMVDGMATFVVDTDGAAHVGAWGSAELPAADHIAGARQNLSLIVDGGAVASDIGGSDELRWGKTLGRTVLVWRSGVGETADGAIVYVAGPGFTVASLSDILQRAGAVRAMQLDINDNWVSFMTWTDGKPSNLLKDMKKPADRYMQPGNRDFFAATAR